MTKNRNVDPILIMMEKYSEKSVSDLTTIQESYTFLSFHGMARVLWEDQYIDGLVQALTHRY